MKFSKKKKAKMRKINQRRINRVHKYMIGHCVDYEYGYTVKDQAKIKGVIYLLVEEGNRYAIYKIVKICEYVRLSEKKILQNQKEFSDHKYWNDHSAIQINDEGKIESVKRFVQHVTWKNNKLVCAYVLQS